MVVKLLTDLIKIYFRNSYSVFVREKIQLGFSDS